MLNLKLSWFNERAISIPHPAPWQSAHLELSNIPTRYAWQDLRLYTHTLSTQATPVYLKKKQEHHFHLHADWMAAEPGIHHMRLVQISQPQVILWETHFFLGAPPLTQSLWLKILQETYHQSRLRFQPQPLVPFTKHPPFMSSPPDIIAEFHAIFALLCHHQGLLHSLSALPLGSQLQWTPLYRTQKISPPLLFRHLSAQPLHTAVPEIKQLPQVPLANYLNFLARVLLSRLKLLCYLLPQYLKTHPFLVEPVQSMWRQGLILWRAWQQHPYSQTLPQWNPQALTELMALAEHNPALKAWIHCARCLSMSIKPDLAPHHIAMGYQGFAYVYQSWCTALLKKSLNHTLQEKGWQAVSAHHPKGVCWQNLTTGERLMLLIEHRFVPATHARDAVFSISRGQQPDVCLLLFEDIDRWKQFLPHSGLVFEIKFRQKDLRPRKVDLDRLHAYRDAVYTQIGMQKSPLFIGGALLYPGHHETYPPGLQALTCLPDQELRLEYLLTQLLTPKEHPYEPTRRSSRLHPSGAGHHR